MKMRLPLFGPVVISTSIMCCISLTTISQVPFTRLPDIFCSKIIRQLSCRVKVWGGTPDMLRELETRWGKPLSVRLAQ
jgi:hypothetical protein